MLKIKTESKCVTIAGDWHGSLQQATTVLDLAYQRNCDLVLQVGDFGIWDDDKYFLDSLQEHLQTYNQTLLFIDGNHENFDLLHSYPINPATGLRPVRPSIMHIPRGTRFTVNDVSFLAVGGAYSVDRQWRTLNKSYWRQETVTQTDIDKALDAPSPFTDILLMHDSPYPAPNPITDDPARQAIGMRQFGYRAIDQATEHRRFISPIFTHTEPHILIHGHYHEFWVGQYTHPSGIVSCV